EDGIRDFHVTGVQTCLFRSAVAGLWRGYKALLHLTWSEMLQYRAAVFIWTLWSLAGPIIHLSVWSSIVAAEGALAGYDRGAIVRSEERRGGEGWRGRWVTE